MTFFFSDFYDCYDCARSSPCPLPPKTESHIFLRDDELLLFRFTAIPKGLPPVLLLYCPSPYSFLFLLFSLDDDK